MFKTLFQRDRTSDESPLAEIVAPPTVVEPNLDYAPIQHTTEESEVQPPMHETAAERAPERVDPIHDTNLPPKHRKAYIRKALADIDLEIANLQRRKVEMRELHGSL